MPGRPLDTNLLQKERPIEAPSVSPQFPGTNAPAGKDFSLTSTLFNVPGSALNVLKGAAQAVAHPVQTTQALADIASGGLEKGIVSAVNVLAPGKPIKGAPSQREQQFNQVVSFFKDRYGGIENIKKTVQEDPVGFLLDISTVLTGGGAAAGKVPQLAKVAKVAAVAGEALDPFSAAGRLAKAGFTAAGKVGAKTLGLTTGAGEKAIVEAYRNPTDEFTKALRGQTTETEVVGQAREALAGLRTERRVNYQEQLKTVKGFTNIESDLEPIKIAFQKKLDDFGVKVVPDENGVEILDFGRSAIRTDKAATADLTEIKKLVDDWGSQVGDRNPLGMDILKQNLDEFYSESSSVRAIVADLRKKVHDTLAKDVPGYEKMVSDYEKATRDIKEIEKTLSLKNTVATDTSVKKLLSVLRENQEYRQVVLEKLQTPLDSKLTQEIAGIALRSGVPRGLVSKLFLGGAGVAFFGFNPVMLLLIAVSIPRGVGEFARALGLTAQQVNRVNNFLTKYNLTSPAVRRAILQVTRVSEKANQNKPSEKGKESPLPTSSPGRSLQQ